MLYHAYELAHAAVSPMRLAARLGQEALQSPFNPFAASIGARAGSAFIELFINATRRYGKPEFGLDETEVSGTTVPVMVEEVMELPFCKLLHFKRDSAVARARNDPPVLVVAPMSGHYATLLRGTVEAMLPEHEVYITDWTDARDVPLVDGVFDLDDYVDYVREFCRFIARRGERAAVMAVCQPGVPVMVAASLMAEDADPARPASVTLMGSPIDTARNPKVPNDLATEHPLEWFESNVIVTVPWPNKGFMRRVYPGFLQLSGFMSMNLDRHLDAHLNHFRHLVRGDGESASAHRSFYDEYLAVMDLTEEFYLQTIDRVFQRRLLANNAYDYRDRRVNPGAVRDVGFLTIEGEKDDITGIGQTEAAHDLLVNLPAEKKAHWVQPKVGHYGVFNGSRWRQHIQPKVREFIRARRTPVRG
ncbi:polyhydroxyalkanoate depolymerase [Oceanicella sp. SM1341]|uniref:polyhydroxyalkanoate depolymerase n=1 Tax=Oceanicella sp. SM1341 TaxID=1548889 RepID=UPI000E508D12|nr:polyhydroxyalkanoate depolymerase [Oceanicella sp. SM1341]